MSFASNTPNRPRDAALEYAEAGFMPVALKPGTKKPSGGLGWQSKASRDPAYIRRHFRRSSNVGLQMGQVDYRDRQLFCLDLDTKNGADLRRFVGGREWPTTVNASTPSGGGHYLFWSAPGTRVFDSTHALGRGLDLKGLMGAGDHGGQIAVEPSSVPDARGDGRPGHYLWIIKPTSVIAQAPDWLMDAIRKHQGNAKTLNRRRPGEPPGKAVPAPSRPCKPPTPKMAPAPALVPFLAFGTSLLADSVERYPVAPDMKGDRNTQMLKLCTSLVCRGVDDATTEQVLTDWWDYWHASGAYHSPASANAIRSQVAYARRSLESGKITPSKGKPDASRPFHDVSGLSFEEVSGLLFSPPQRTLVEHLILNVPHGSDRGGPEIADLCLLKTLLILLAEDRAEGWDKLLRTTHREMTGVLRESFGLDIPLVTFSRMFGRWRSRSDRSSVPGFEGRKASRSSRAAVLEEVEVGRMTARGYVPSVYRPSAALEHLLRLEGADWALPGPDQALAAAGRPEVPPGLANATEDQEGPWTEGGPNVDADTQEPRVIKLAGPASLKYPAKPGLIEVLASLRSTGRFAPEEWDRAAEWIAASGGRDSPGVRDWDGPRVVGEA